MLSLQAVSRIFLRSLVAKNLICRWSTLIKISLVFADEGILNWFWSVEEDAQRYLVRIIWKGNPSVIGILLFVSFFRSFKLIQSRCFRYLTVNKCFKPALLPPNKSTKYYVSPGFHVLLDSKLPSRSLHTAGTGAVLCYAPLTVAQNFRMLFQTMLSCTSTTTLSSCCHCLLQ